MDALAELDAFLAEAGSTRSRPSERWLHDHPALANALYARWRGGTQLSVLYRYAQKQGFPYQYVALHRAFQTAQQQGHETFTDV